MDMNDMTADKDIIKRAREIMEKNESIDDKIKSMISLCMDKFMPDGEAE